jgi:transposase
MTTKRLLSRRQHPRNEASAQPSLEQLDLAGFYASYRLDGWGRAAFEPRMMVSLLLYAYARGERSSRGIERKCVEDVAYRVIAAHQAPDHATIARFRVRHEESLADLCTEVLSLCGEAGLVKVGVIAIDGTKVHANASHHANLDSEQIAREILKEAAEVCAAEDELFGDARGDELPPEFRSTGELRKRLRDAKQRLDAKRAAEKKPVPRSRAKRLREGKKRLEQELELERRVRADCQAWRARGISADGRRFGGRDPKPHEPPEQPRGKINTTDPDSRNVKTPRSYTQGYNAQGVVNEHQIVLAAEVTVSSPDFGQLQPMVKATNKELEAIGVTDTPGWRSLTPATGTKIDNVVSNGTQVLIPPDAGKRDTPRPGSQGGRYAWMRNVLATGHGGGLYRRRKAIVEPVFAQTKFNRRIDRFHRRGRSAARSEWRLITATHNLRG